MDWMLMPLRRYADFAGRSRRKEYWMFALGVMGVVFLILALALLMSGGLSGMAQNGGFLAGPFMIIFVVFWLGLIVPSIAVQVRRFHDQDKSGWFVLLNFIPYIGGLIVLVFMFLEGTRGPNRFGPDPKADG
jgi:uncharacterized membrane protein YhaH (DUF805 family)